MANLEPNLFGWQPGLQSFGLQGRHPSVAYLTLVASLGKGFQCAVSFGNCIHW